MAASVESIDAVRVTSPPFISALTRTSFGVRSVVRRTLSLLCLRNWLTSAEGAP